jgi:hypothetical protein
MVIESRAMRHVLVLWMLCVLGSACVTPTVSLHQGPRTYTAGAYEEVLTRWTRAGRGFTLTGFLDDQLMATATYESWDFRWAYVVRYASDFHLTTDERSRLLRTSLEASQREHEFYVTIAMPNRRWADLAAPTSAWRVVMVNDRNLAVLPTAIERVRQPGVIERTYFPYTTVWRQVFRVRFPTHSTEHGPDPAALIDVHTRHFSLRFTGPVGQLDLTWNLTAS